MFARHGCRYACSFTGVLHYFFPTLLKLRYTKQCLFGEVAVAVFLAQRCDEYLLELGHANLDSKVRHSPGGVAECNRGLRR